MTPTTLAEKFYLSYVQHTTEHYGAHKVMGYDTWMERIDLGRYPFMTNPHWYSKFKSIPVANKILNSLLNIEEETTD